MLKSRRDAACSELRQQRDARYQLLLEGQQTARDEFRALREAGRSTDAFLAGLDKPQAKPGIKGQFRAAADQVADRGNRLPKADEPAERSKVSHEGQKKGGLHISTTKVAISLFDALFFDLTTLGSAKPEFEQPQDNRGDSFAIAAEETVTNQIERERLAKEEDEKQRKQRQFYRD